MPNAPSSGSEQPNVPVRIDVSHIPQKLKSIDQGNRPDIAHAFPVEGGTFVRIPHPQTGKMLLGKITFVSPDKDGGTVCCFHSADAPYERLWVDPQKLQPPLNIEVPLIRMRHAFTEPQAQPAPAAPQEIAILAVSPEIVDSAPEYASATNSTLKIMAIGTTVVGAIGFLIISYVVSREGKMEAQKARVALKAPSTQKPGQPPEAKSAPAVPGTEVRAMLDEVEEALQSTNRALEDERMAYPTAQWLNDPAIGHDHLSIAARRLAQRLQRLERFSGTEEWKEHQAAVISLKMCAEKVDAMLKRYKKDDAPEQKKLRVSPIPGKDVHALLLKTERALTLFAGIPSHDTPLPSANELDDPVKAIEHLNVALQRVKQRIAGLREKSVDTKWRQESLLLTLTQADLEEAIDKIELSPPAFGGGDKPPLTKPNGEH